MNCFGYALTDYICGYCLDKWKILSIVDEGVNYENHVHLEHWDFYARDVDEAWE